MLQTSTNNVYTAPEIAETLNYQFKSVFATEDTYSIPDMPESPYPPITDINITCNSWSIQTLIGNRSS